MHQQGGSKDQSRLDSFPPVSNTCPPDADPFQDAAAIERMCRVWAEVGRAILLRRRYAREVGEV